MPKPVVWQSTLSALISSVLLSTPVFCADSDPVFHFTPSAGAHAVGLQVIQQFDYSRPDFSADDQLKPDARGSGRPLQTLVWYPVSGRGRGTGKPMTVGDYENLSASEAVLAGTKRALSVSLWAVRDAPATAGRFPVVVYAPSFSAPSWENADLCEYLASHGYIVIASPSLGAHTRNMTSDLAGVEAQARDISFLIGFARTLPNTDISRAAVVGYSWGGLANLFAAARDNRIDALVALDGSMRYFPGLVKQANDVHPDQMTIPLLYIARGRLSLEDQARNLSAAMTDGPNVLNAWTHADLLILQMLALPHIGFSSLYQRNDIFWQEHFPEQQNADYGRDEAVVAYAWMARYTLAFLNAYIKNQPADVAFLKNVPVQNGVPRHFMAVSYRAAGKGE